MSASATFSAEPDTPELKILTYNVHSCIGTDRKLDPHRIADVIAQPALTSSHCRNSMSAASARLASIRQR
jgi:hypothetical protein